MRFERRSSLLSATRVPRRVRSDGIWGRRTEAAYQAFLRDNDLPATETLTVIALRAMRAIARRAGGDAVAGRDPAGVRESDRTTSDAGALLPAPVRPAALHRAAQAGDINGLKAALDAGVDVDAQDSRGWTALMHAANKGYTLLVVPLLGAGADPDLRAADGATALFVAALHGHAEIVAALVGAEADASLQGPKGMTPLEVAQARGRFEDPRVAGDRGVAGSRGTQGARRGGTQEAGRGDPACGGGIPGVRAGAGLRYTAGVCGVPVVMVSAGKPLRRSAHAYR